VVESAAVVCTQDCDPANRILDGTNHPTAKPYEVFGPLGHAQVLFPEHCIQHTPWAAIQSGLTVKPDDALITNGAKGDVDSHSCFFDVVKSSSTNADAEPKKGNMKGW
jgi:nicotinamidase/pyrazinamidase